MKPTVIRVPLPNRLTLLVAALVACVGLSSAPAVGMGAAGTYAQQAHRATNKARVANSLAKLSKDDCLKRYAVKQAKAMAAAREMFHQDLVPILTECKLGLTGENVAYGFPDGKSVVNDGWLNSAPHRANILNPAYQLMGIAARKGGDGKWYVSQVFGRPLGLPIGPLP
jgi:uncharacterized protein YkwD